jgi:hypothetical protein
VPAAAVGRQRRLVGTGRAARARLLDHVDRVSSKILLGTGASARKMNSSLKSRERD